MATDRAYTHQGTDATDGNYARTNDVDARAIRLLTMQRGKWPGGRGQKVGSRFHELLGNSEEERNRIPGMVLEAWEPLIDDGSISDVETEVTDLTPYGYPNAVGYVASALNRTTGDTIKYAIPTPWLE